MGDARSGLWAPYTRAEKVSTPLTLSLPVTQSACFTVAIAPLRTNESRCTDAFPHFPMIKRKSGLGIKATYHPVQDPDLEIGGGGGGGVFGPSGLSLV